MTQQPMSRALSQEIALEHLDAHGRSIDLPTSFEYDPADPWAVWISFRGTGGRIRWAVARDLLLRGMTDPAGEGDIQLWPSVDELGRAAVVMEMSSPDGRLVTQIRTHELYRFLSRTFAVVPLGTESIDLDLLVEDLLGSQAE